MEYDTILAAILLILLLYFSLDFDKHYSPIFHTASRQPFFRFIAGLCVTLIAAQNPMLATIALIVVFFWIADIHLLSTLKLQPE